MKFIENTKVELRKNGYKQSAKYHYYVETFCFYKIENGKFKCVVVMDNCGHNLVDQTNFDDAAQIVCKKYNCQMQDVLFVVLSTKKTYRFQADNIVMLDPYTGIIRYVKNTTVYESEKDILTAFSKTNKVYQKYVRMILGTLIPERFQYAVLLLIVINVLAFVKIGSNSTLFGISAETVLHKGQTYRLFSYGFTHMNIIHLIGNMICLLLTGSQLEQRNGSIETITVYFFGLIYSGIVSIFSALFLTARPEIFTIGASGAVMAIVAALAFDIITDPNMKKQNYILYAGWIILSGFFISGVDNACHFGGAIAGVVVMFTLKKLRTAFYQQDYIQTARKLRTAGRANMLSPHTGYEKY